MLLRLVGVMNLVLILSHLFSIQGREPYFDGFVEEANNVGLYPGIYRPISIKLSMMILEATKFYILISVWMTLTFIQGHSC